MPGIVGLVTTMPSERAHRELARMLACVRHEAFYSSGTCTDEVLGVYVGWTARKGSFADSMPVCNEQGNVSLVFAGEDYPELGTIEKLKKRGHALGTSASSYLVHLYEEDSRFPVGLNGIFHGMLLARALGTATLFNDRYGIHRIYYHESKDAFYFAAEAKAILAVRPELRRPDPRGLGEFVSCGCVLENRTLFDGINVLPGASAWTFRNGAIEKKSKYFEPREWEEQAPLDAEAYYRELRDVIEKRLPHYFNGQERVALALTGGLDTRVIMALRRPSPQTVPCYTFGSTFRDNQDVRLARKVAQACEQSHDVIRAGQDFLSRFAHYAERCVHLTDGSIDTTRSADLFVSEKARQIAPVKVVGTYGSEILTAIPTFEPSHPRSGLLSRDLLQYVQQAKTTYDDVRRGHPVTFAAFLQSPWRHYGMWALEQTQLTVRSPFLDNEFVRTVYRAPMLSGHGRDVRLRLVREGNPTLARFRTDRGVGGNGWRLGAAVSRSVREFTFRAEHAYDADMPQWLAGIDHLFSPFHLERLFLGRHKAFHYRVWYRDALALYVREMLLDSRTLSRPYLERSGVEAVVRGHLNGKRNYTSEIHKILTLELLHRLFFDAR
jgi:asparagine synthase (glutamine-hydrolysing)